MAFPNGNTQVANARLFFQKILKEQVEKMDRMLYLDSDTIILGDLSGLLNKEAPIYAVRDNTPSSYAKGLGLSTYYNSGVLYIDVKKWLEENYQEQIENYIENNQGKKFTYPDQDILNVVLQGQITELSREYNMAPYAYALRDEKLTNYCKRYNVPLDELLLARNNPKILHSTGLLGIKPWTDNEVNPYNDIFRRYLYKVNPEFELQELDSMKKLLSTNPRLFNSLFLLKSYTPECLQGIVKKTALTFYKQKKTNRNKK
jgi:lipopolysaccharide biosynthesis glycosyltransferase